MKLLLTDTKGDGCLIDYDALRAAVRIEPELHSLNPYTILYIDRWPDSESLPYVRETPEAIHAQARAQEERSR